MDSIIYKYRRLLTEGYNFTNVDEVMSALEANQIGVKIQPEYKKETKWGYTCEKLRKFFNKCEEYGIKDTTYGVQLLLSKVPPYNLEDIINTDGLYELLKSRKKPWVKELKEYQTLMNSKVWSETTVNDLHAFEKVVQDSQSNHGKAAKGGGDINGVKVPYDDGTWKLMIPVSFQGEKAAAFYIKDGKETPTEWCTRADEGYYKRYTKDAPLYIIRNMKTGKSYQMAFTNETHWEDNDSEIRVHFLDQNDVKGDEITQGDLSKIPNELLKHIPIPGKNKTMANYNTDKSVPSPNAGKKGYIKTGQQSWGKEQIIDKKYQREICKLLDDYFEKRGQPENLLNKYGEVDIVKVVSNKDYFKEKLGQDPLTDYASNGKKTEDNYQPKARKVRYYFLGHPNDYIEIIASKKAGIKPSVNNCTLADSFVRSVLQYTAFYEMGYGIPKKLQNNNFDFASKSAHKARERNEALLEREKKFKKIIQDYATSIGAERLGIDVSSIGSGGLSYRTKPSSVLKDEQKADGRLTVDWRGAAVGKKWHFNGEIPGSKKMSLDGIGVGKRFLCRVECTKLPISKENIHLFEENGVFGPSIPEVYKDFAFKVSKKMFETWRKLYSDEIVQNRAEGRYTKNM